MNYCETNSATAITDKYEGLNTADFARSILDRVGLRPT